MNNHSVGSLEEMMRQAQGGDKRAYESLLDILIPIFKTFFLNRSPGLISDIDDLTQDTLIAIHKMRHTHIQGKPFLPWALSIANYKLQDRYRQEYRKRRIQDSLNVINTTHPATTKCGAGAVDARDEIEKLLLTLNDQQREILLKVKYEGYSIAEVAKERNISESLVKVTIHRAMKKLFGNLQP